MKKRRGDRGGEGQGWNLAGPCEDADSFSGEEEPREGSEQERHDLTLVLPGSLWLLWGQCSEGLGWKQEPQKGGFCRVR